MNLSIADVAKYHFTFLAFEFCFGIASIALPSLPLYVFFYSLNDLWGIIVVFSAEGELFST
jgi:hypothetical protein